MAIYSLDLDLLETAKDEYASSAEKLNTDIDISYKTVTNTNTEIYAGIDATTFRDEFTHYIDKDFTDAWTTVSNIGKALDNGLDDARECKKICNDFILSLGGTGNGKSKEDMKGVLYCDQSMINLLKSICTTAMTYAEEIRMESESIDQVLADLQVVKIDSVQYTDVIRKGCDKVDKLEDHSGELTTYASAAETIDDSLKSALDACVTEPYWTVVYNMNDEISPQAEILIEIMCKPEEELTEEDRNILEKNLRILTENNQIKELQKVAESIGNAADGAWTAGDVYVAAKILAYGEEVCNADLTAEIYNKMVKVELIGTTTDAHTNSVVSTYTYEMGLDKDKVISILEQLDPEENASAYYSLQSRSGYQVRKEKTIFGMTTQVPEIEYDLTFETENGRLISVFELEGSKGMIASVEMNEVDKWLLPDYKLAQYEEKRAKEMTEEYFSDKKILHDMFENFGAEAYSKDIITSSSLIDLTDEEYEEAVKMYNLSKKTDNITAIQSGFAHAIPFYDLIMDKCGEETYGNYNYLREQADMQSPVASAAGNAVGNVFVYAAGSELVKGVPGVSKITQKAGAAVGKGAEKLLSVAGVGMADLGGTAVANAGTKLAAGGAKKAGQAIGNGVTNILAGTTADIALDTIPHAANDALSGMSVSKVLVNAAENMGRNLTMNVLAEGALSLPAGVKYVKNRVTPIADEVADASRTVNAVLDMGGHLDDAVESGTSSLIDIDAIRPKLKTEPDTAFFWSGRTKGIGGAENAANIAKSRGGVTLESTIETQNIVMPEWDFNNPSTMEAWDLASGAYAEQVSGEIRAVIGSELRPGNIWENVELPRLKNNPNVTKITTIDPKTGVENVIFER